MVQVLMKLPLFLNIIMLIIWQLLIPNEGLLLRETGLRLPVMVMNPDEDSFDRIF